MVRLTLSQAIDGFLLHKQAEGRSPATLADYANGTGKLLTFAGDVPLPEVTVATLRAFFGDLYHSALKPKSIQNVRVALSSMYNWLVAEGFASVNPIPRIQKPNVSPPLVQPYTQAEVVALIQACQHTAAWRTRPATRTQRPTAGRDVAIVYLLLDTGIRNSELCALRVGDFDQATGRLTVRQGKGRKPRSLVCSAKTRSLIWRHLLDRDQAEADDALFASTETGGRLSRYALTRLIRRLAERAGVPEATVHRFRHTFAIEYLRNGGDIYTLQEFLGHTSLEMVRRYLHIAQTDLDAQHKNASPVRNWRL